MSTPSTTLTIAPPRIVPWRRAAGVFGLGVLGLVAITAILHDAVAPYDRGATPGPSLVVPDAVHVFGTDQLGRDVLSEIIHALGVSMFDAGIGFAVALLFGTLAGLGAAHLLGRMGTVLRLFTGVVAAVPVLLLAILFAVLAGYGQAAFAAGLAAAPAQFVRSFDRTRALLSSRQADYARASGITSVALFKRDLNHTFVASLVSLAARAFAAVTITLATMSFFGFGAAPPDRDLGLMIASARDVIDTGWWAAAFPAGVLILVVLAAHLAAGFSDDDKP
jgi:peptide/nickel transport system permease protein